MPVKGPKVKELARELGVAPRAILDRCRAEGYSVQNRITRLSPELVRQIRGWLQNSSTTCADSPDES